MQRDSNTILPGLPLSAAAAASAASAAAATARQRSTSPSSPRASSLSYDKTLQHPHPHPHDSKYTQHSHLPAGRPGNSPPRPYASSSAAHSNFQLPLSPPASTSASYIDASSASPSPRISNLTPLSAPMSAEPSQQSFTPTTQDANVPPPSSSSSNTNIASYDATTVSSSVPLNLTQNSPLSTSATSFIPDSQPQPSSSSSSQKTQPQDGQLQTRAPPLSQKEDTALKRPEKHRLEGEDDEAERKIDPETGALSNKRRRTNHDRDNNKESPLPDAVASPLKLADADPGAVTARPFYKILNQTHSIARPHPSQNLFALYDLNGIAATVARNDPITGEKINKLRKSYEGKVKELAGRNRASNKPGDLMGLVHYPDEEFHIQRVMGKELSSDISDDFLSKLTQATRLEPGKLPVEDDERWKSALGLDDGAVVKGGVVTGSLAVSGQDRRGASLGSTKSPMSAGGSTSVAAAGAGGSGDLVRPRRKGTKRRYNDDSFEGYGDGYIDDGGGGGAGADGGMLSMDEDESVAGRMGGGSTKRKRRKGSSTSTSPHYTTAQTLQV